MPLSFAELFVGIDAQVPLLDGRLQPYINLDNAASTPALHAVQQAVDQFLIYYSSVHRGTGFKSQLSTQAYEDARQIVLHFLGASPQDHTCIFGKNTTEAVNKLARRFPFTTKRNVVLTSAMEHHSNDLPWRAAAHTVHIRLTVDGRLDEQDFDNKLTAYGDTDPAHAAERLGVLPMILEHVPHFLNASVLGYEFGIGVRSGCFCAHPYIMHLLGLDEKQARTVRENILSGDRTNMPGLIRASFGLYNSQAEIDRFVAALTSISKGEYSGVYTQNTASGEYLPQNWQPDFKRFFSL